MLQPLLVESMPAIHRVDTEKRVIITTWDGDASDEALIAALKSYLKEFRNSAPYQSYDELLDFSLATEFHLSTKGIVELSNISRQADVPGIQSKLAIIAKTPLIFGLSKMYVAYRNMLSETKQISVFKNSDDALTWLSSAEDSKIA